jgi:hypothetical protein
MRALHIVYSGQLTMTRNQRLQFEGVKYEDESVIEVCAGCRKAEKLAGA